MDLDGGHIDGVHILAPLTDVGHTDVHIPASMTAVVHVVAMWGCTALATSEHTAVVTTYVPVVSHIPSMAYAGHVVIDHVPLVTCGYIVPPMYAVHTLVARQWDDTVPVPKVWVPEGG